MTRIAYIAPVGVFGGVRIVAEHLNRLSDRGHACTLISTDNQPLTWLPTRFEQRPFQDPGNGYDVIVGTATTTWGAARKMADANGAKAVGLMQMADWLFSNPGTDAYNAAMQEFATTPLDGVMAISEWLAKLNDEVPGREVYRIRNGIDTNLFYHDPFQDSGNFDGVTVVLEGYNHNRCKDIDGMAFAAIRRARYDYGLNLRVIGFSQYDPQFEFDAFWKSPPQHIIRKIYSTADIFLKASRYEGRPGPHMEAMACGTAVCTAIGTGDDDLFDDVNCLKSQYGDLKKLTDNLVKLSGQEKAAHPANQAILSQHDNRVREKLTRQGLEYVKNSYSWEPAIDMVEKALTGSVTEPTGQRADYAYDLASYNQLQNDIVAWEGGQARWLGETLADMLEPTSVIDIGCGPGIYLVPFKPDAIVMGVDGAPDAGKALEPGELLTIDLRQDWYPPKMIDNDGGVDVWDLSLCIETGEHLPPDRADYLVELLTQASDVCFFSAAQPGQGGTMHLNEQPKSYWLDKFRAHGWDLHPRNDELADKILNNAECRKVQWLIGNSMLLWRVPSV